MNQFSGDIAATLEIALIGLSLVVLHFGVKEGSGLMKASAYIMLIGGVLGLICTSMFWFTYWNAGVFEPSAQLQSIIK